MPDHVVAYLFQYRMARVSVKKNRKIRKEKRVALQNKMENSKQRITESLLQVSFNSVLRMASCLSIDLRESRQHVSG
jgi:hypothetical protein